MRSIICFLLILFFKGFHAFSLAEFSFNVPNKIVNFFGGELCTEYFFKPDFEGLISDFSNDIFGQPFVNTALLPILKSFVNEPHFQKKALVLSLNGSPGTGKNFVSSFIVKRFYKYGMKSKFVHYFSGRINFTNTATLQESKENLQISIINSIRECESSTFIFDEIEKMPDGILDVIKGFIDYDAFHYGLDFRKSMFIFLSNAGMEAINKKTLELWERGVDRKNFKLSDFQDVIEHIYKHPGALKHSALITSALVDVVVPFLPLEKHHLQKCIKKEASIRSEKITDEQIEEILSYTDLQPPETKLFARHGCKNIQNELIIVLRRSRFTNDEL